MSKLNLNITPTTVRNVELDALFQAVSTGYADEMKMAKLEIRQAEYEAGYSADPDRFRSFSIRSEGDHNHSTGKVRGIIHGIENLALGLLEDSPVVFRQTTYYLEKS